MKVMTIEDLKKFYQPRKCFCQKTLNAIITEETHIIGPHFDVTYHCTKCGFYIHATLMKNES